MKLIVVTARRIYSSKFKTSRLCPESSNPLPFYIPLTIFYKKRHPFRIPSIEGWRLFLIPTKRISLLFSAYGFPLSRNFKVRTHVHFTRVNIPGFLKTWLAKISTHSTTWQFKTTKLIQRPIKSFYLTPGSKLVVPRSIPTSPNLK